MRRRRRCGAGGRATARRASGFPPGAGSGNACAVRATARRARRRTRTCPCHQHREALRPCPPGVGRELERNRVSYHRGGDPRRRSGAELWAADATRSADRSPEGACMRAPSGLGRNSGYHGKRWLEARRRARPRSSRCYGPGRSARQVCPSSCRAQRHRGAGKGVKDDEPGATARQATSTTTRRTPTCGRRAPAAASDRGGGSLERPPHWPSWPRPAR